MNKKIIFGIRILIFLAIFFAITSVIAFILREDHSSYGRILMHELYEQETIDVLFCGASHVSHGMNPQIADKILGKNTFNCGTAGQTIDATYAIIQQALKLYKIETVCLELDFSIATKPPINEKRGFKADYLICNQIKDFGIRFNFLRTMSSPQYYLNSLLPIGRDKYMTLAPGDLIEKAKFIFSGKYFNYAYECDDDVYVSKGCLLDARIVQNGTFQSDEDEGNIPVSKITAHWNDILNKIIDLCQKHKCKIILYSQPDSDFYLCKRENYDAYYEYAKKIAASFNLPYYDFNLSKNEYLPLEDCDFRDETHFNKSGMTKFSVLMSNLIKGTLNPDSVFLNSYKEKLNLQKDRILGLLLELQKDKNILNVKPICNHADLKNISYEVIAKINGEKVKVDFNNTEEGYLEIHLPKNSSGLIKITSLLNNQKQTTAQNHFTTL